MRPLRSRKKLYQRTELTAEEKANQESIKLYYDAVKHLTTLNTGVILIVFAVSDKVKIAEPAVIRTSLISFVISIVLAIITMTNFGDEVGNLGNLGGSQRGFFPIFTRFLLLLAFLFFTFGLLMLLFPVIKML